MTTDTNSPVPYTEAQIAEVIRHDLKTALEKVIKEDEERARKHLAHVRCLAWMEGFDQGFDAAQKKRVSHFVVNSMGMVVGFTLGMLVGCGFMLWLMKNA
jgi:hypothetical protein